MDSDPIRRGLAGLAAASSVLGVTAPARVAGELERTCARLGLGRPVECFRCELSVGALFGLRLEDGRRIALKVHRPPLGPRTLGAIQDAQGELARAGFPAPPPLGVASFRDRWATAETWLDVGRRPDPARPAVRGALAAAFAEHVRLVPPVGVPAALPRRRLWPRPHSAIFDFRLARGEARWIDAIARRARARMDVGAVVVGHSDWSVKHFRFRAGRPSAVYDWDSLRREREPVLAGYAARTHDAILDGPRPWRPSTRATLAFLDDHDRARARPFTRAERRAALAAAVYVTSYTARCEHALVAAGATDLVTEARASLGGFAQLLAPED